MRVFLGYAMMFNEVKYLADGSKYGKLQSQRAPDAQRDRGKRMFFREPISVRKSLSCVTSEIRAWSVRSEQASVF